MRAAATPSFSAADTAGCSAAVSASDFCIGPANELMHRPALAKADLGLGRMDIHVDLPRLDGKPQRVSGLAILMQHVAIRFAQRVREDAIADEAAVHEKILRIARGRRVRRPHRPPRDR